ncbi:hypothetical protein [Gordonia soli]|uniref:Uncharacterized protein n=1 Tax=Gordonia soli NBRC 108243 TaxID=1223545 RepID=M0QKA8_9ACTN|nr:hypothetical protein [Gordonia soli]GAC68864.1 hypothetical protein GS4_19_00540 [Gordonia soli NBRC 108243]
MTAATADAQTPAPGDLTARQWAARHNALLGRGAADDDPRVAECRAALAYWRCRTVIDAERDQLAPADAAALADSLGGGATTMRT